MKSIITSKSFLAHAAAVVSDERCHLLLAKSIIASKSIFARAAAVVCDDLCHLLFGHCWKCEQTTNKVSNKSASEDVSSAWFVVKTMTVNVFDPLTFVRDE